MPETLQDHLRRQTRSFTAALPEDDVLALGAALAREIARVQEENPAHRPSLDPSDITMEGGQPRLVGSDAGRDFGDPLLQLGGLLASLLTGSTPDVSWRLDGPPLPEMATVRRRAALLGLAAPRREERFPTAALAAAALTRATDAPPTPGGGWMLFRGDAQRSGRAAQATPASLATAWTARVGAVVASPLIVGDLVIAATTVGRVVFLDRERGVVLHEMSMGAPVEASPAVVGGRLYVGTDDGALVRIDIASGREEGRSTIGERVRASPLAVDDHLLAATIDAKGGALLSLESAGKVRWTFRMSPAFSSPALSGSTVVVGGDGGRLHAVDLANGKERWSADLGGKVRSTPAVRDVVVVVASFSGRVAALKVDDGSVLWTRELGHPLYSSVCLGEAAYTVGCHEGHVHGFAPATGADLFTLATRGPVIASPITAGECALVASTDGDLYLVAPDGRVLTTLHLSAAGVQSTAALHEGLLAVGSGDGIHAVRVGA